MRPDVEIHNHKFHHAELRNEVNMSRLADAAGPIHTAIPFYKVYREKLLRLMSQFKAKSASKKEIPATHNPLLQQE
jgi:hypothetical protein